ncbi:MAG: phasin family protein [Candidatus Cloacimonetes bacterium]|nr:phasin family protein [Candidatus Cloacimonadota bacterium]
MIIFDLLKKTMLTGIGIASMTKDKIEELGKKISEESKLSAEEGKKLVKDLLEKSDEARKNLQGQVEKLVKNAMKKLSITTREDLQKLEKRIKKLENLVKKIERSR